MSAYAPMKAVLVGEPVSGPDWLFERKLDGIRCGVIRRGGSAKLVSRSGETLDRASSELVDALHGGGDLVADGEIVAFRRGATSFARLQGRMQIRDPERARRSRFAKRADSAYVATRSRDWLKLKCSRGQELVIGGWTAPKGSRQRLGAILVGYWQDGAAARSG